MNFQKYRDFVSFKPKTIISSTSSRPALALNDCWAKTYIDKEGMLVAGRNVLSHCLIVGSLARALLNRMPSWLQQAFFPVGSELIAAAHDIGKVSPTFQEKLRRKSKKYAQHPLPELQGFEPELEKQWGGHAGVSQIAARAYLDDRYIPQILGSHHGYSSDPFLAGRSPKAEYFGGTPWQEQREKLMQQLQQILDCSWPVVNNALQASLLAGLTTVSDWIGSGTLFEDPSNEKWSEDIDRALDEAGFVFPKLRQHLSFQEIFGVSPRPIQQRLIDLCQTPGIYVLEAPMGIGKTEAALYAAYQMMTLGQATGIYFALPTQLTSDKLHDRMNQFLKKIIAPDSHHKKALLVHGNAWLKLHEMGVEGEPGGSWFEARKRGILAPFSVGTIDQALMAVMHVKHGFVRTFGLTGKVVILDEVHSYDSYTGTIMDTLIDTLRNLKCTVIILSATLTTERKKSLLKTNPQSNQYPLISAFIEKEFKELAIPQDSDVEVVVHRCQNSDIAIEEALLRAEEGHQVLWIENTIAEAQQQYKLLAARASELNIHCGLLHSRFLQIDRQAIEEKWVRLFGKDGANRRRERGRILVGTQVLEQSLDIDADFLISRMCPTDMMLQRLGRLWRHSTTVRPENAQREVWILSPSLEFAVRDFQNAFGKSAMVYAPYILLRSLEIWENIDSVRLPVQIRQLLEKTYEIRAETGVWDKLQQSLEQRKKELAGRAQIGLSQDGKTLPEHQASTRYSEQDMIEVLLVHDYCHTPDGIRITFLNQEEMLLSKAANQQNRKQRRELAAILMQNIVKVAESSAPLPVPTDQLDPLRNYLYIGEEDAALRIAKVRDDGVLMTLDGRCRAHDSKLLNYSPILGYIHE